MILRRFLVHAVCSLALLLPAPAQADAASYIRTLFDATIAASRPAVDCHRFSPLARFAAGVHWRSFSADERQTFDGAFCDLAHEALARLRARYPDLALRVIDSHPGPRDMAWVRSNARAGGADWPVDWLVGNPGDDAYLADLKVMGVSLAIMLRGLAAGIEDPHPAALVKSWRQVLDRALPE
jgi:ABC-type transporter MlaC component